MELVAALQDSGFGAWARGSAYAYPLANLLHLAGLVLLVGAIGLLDLRLAGAFRALPVVALSRVLTPLAVVGLVLMAPSGLTLFAADAEALARSTVFRWKLALIAAALVNAVAFRLLWGRRLSSWDGAAPPVARIMALASLLSWIAVGALGRLIAYA
ncbi:hypothetical protein DDF62_05645 [Caulobacter radicis]|uniref:hypothetical protein n=1 Tax=Caulobacter radicis TaxID=2172650 RepID=UPI000D56C61F|nr:hypothetical protein [Caulobacter radicis]PVM92610.1 hypothetical protein DDF62_05645 [Caulobacter radicis]